MQTVKNLSYIIQVQELLLSSYQNSYQTYTMKNLRSFSILLVSLLFFLISSEVQGADLPNVEVSFYLFVYFVIFYQFLYFFLIIIIK